MLARSTFVLGAPRSGTTLLRVMLDGHSQLFSPPEMVLAPFETMAQRTAKLTERFWEKGGLRRAWMALFDVDVDTAKAAVADLDPLSVPEVYARLQAALGDRMLVDKCPHLGAYPEALPRLDSWFDAPRFVWIVRHPGSVIRSIENMPMAEVMLQGYASDAREIWRVANQNIGAFLATLPSDRWHMVHYEELVRDPEAALRPVCDLLEIPYEDAMARPYDGDRMREGPRGARAIGDPNMAGRGRIQPELADRWLKGFDHRRLSAETKAYAATLGYDLEGLELPPITRVSAALDALWESVRKLEHGIAVPQDIDAVEGRRFLLRMLTASLDTMIEHNDPDRPVVHHTEGPTRKMFADCPDTDYLRAAIRTTDERVYRVTGRIPEGTTYVGVLLYRRGGQVGNRLVDTDLQPDADGRFEVRIATTPQPGTWLEAHGDETAVMVRQYFEDRTTQPPIEVEVELLDKTGPPGALDPVALAKDVERSRRMMEAIFQRTLAAYKMAQGALLRFIELDGATLFPTPDNRYQVCWYRFGYNQAMVVRGRLPKCRYFSFTLYNLWMESLEYRYRPVHRNHTQIATDDEGNFELILAHEDPGHPNWLDTSGHPAGYLVARTLLAEEPAGRLEVQVGYFDELRAG